MINNVGALQLTQNTLQKNRQTESVNGQSFADYLKNALNQVNQDQITSEQLTKALATGEVEDLHQVMIASQQAMLSLQLTVQIRNKVVEAYQEIMRMQI